jgi:hypothetical protein
MPLPLIGKKCLIEGWSDHHATNDGEIELWAKLFPQCDNTGILCRNTPTLDIDILDPEAAKAVEDLVCDRFEDRGHVLVRIGKPPKRAIPFRCAVPFKKIAISLVAPKTGGGQKLEFLGDGQQVVVAGIHPDTGQAYRWHGGELGTVRHEDLPEIDAAEAQRLIEAAADLLCREHGYTRAAPRPRSNGNAAPNAAGSADWGYLVANIREGRELHDSLRDLAAKLVASGMDAGAAVNFLRGLMDEAGIPHDVRWQARYAEIPRLVDSAQAKFREAAVKPDAASACTIGETLDVFKRWLILNDLTPVYAVLGAVAANLLEGDPVWLGVIGPPSSAKTELLNSISLLPKVTPAASLTVAGLLSGTPKKQAASGAKGGLLRQIGDFGIVALKDFTSVLSMHTETRAEVLAALREIFDGAWTRHLGSDGGRTLDWKGKVGLVFACTAVIDSHYGVIGSMGDRFLLTRLAPTGKGQFNRALAHVGSRSKQMRRELAEAVAGLFASRRAEPQPINNDEIAAIDRKILLAVRLRGSIDRDRSSREIENVHGAEGTARIGLALERLLAGLDTLGVDRMTALGVVTSVALDSVPPNRRAAYEFLDSIAPAEAATTAVANKLGLPTVTARRVLEDLAAYGLVERKVQGQGKADNWTRLDWEDQE